VIAQSTAEVEYVAAAAAEDLWIRKLLIDLHMEEKRSAQIYVDNQAAILIANSPVFHGKTKYFKIKLYFLREVQRDGEVHLVYKKLKIKMLTY